MSARAMDSGIISATGLTVVKPHDNPALDIVFIHGFNGHPERTWKHKRGDFRQSNHDIAGTSERPSKMRRITPLSRFHQSKGSVHSAVYWPCELLSETVPNARILTYGYDSNIRHLADRPINRTNIRGIAWDFLVALEAGRRDAPTRPLLFVAHSMGGIVVKELLRRSNRSRQGQAHLRDVSEFTIGIMFFGTPHGGTDPLGVIQRAIVRGLKVAGFRMPEQIVNTLLPSSDWLEELRDEFSPMAHEKQWMIHSFQEQLGVIALNGDKVVEDTSSCLNFPAIEIIEHIGRDHREMCRFSGPEDIEYGKVRDALRRMTARLPAKQVPTTSLSLTKEQRQRLQESLGFKQIDARYATVKKAHEKTCKWLKTKQEYLDWLEPDKIEEHHRLLWIKGNPGTGKSTLMKFAFDQARRTTKDNVILYFFFNARGQELERSTIGMYRSLLLQLLQRFAGLDAIFDSIRLTSWLHGGEIQWNTELLKDLFEQAVLNLPQSPVVCFIDALDECDEDEIRDMASFFAQLGNQTVAANIQFLVCFSSRHYPNITVDRGLELILEHQDGHAQDIAAYIDSELKIGDGKDVEAIKVELQRKASGIFIWVFLVVDILNKEYGRGNVDALHNRLAEIPSNLHNLFRDILTRDSRDKDRLILCLQWILFAKQPLTPEEFFFALRAKEFALPATELTLWDRDLITLNDMQRFTIDSSKGLAETTKSKTSVVQFIHESVRDFLLKQNGLQEIWPDLGDQFQGQSHEQLKECCLKHLYATAAARTLALSKQLSNMSKKDIANRRRQARKCFPFLKYAVHGVLYHTDKAKSGGLAQNGFLESFPIQEWIDLYNLLERLELRHHTLEANLLHHAASQGYVAVAELLITSGANKDTKDKAGRTPLYWAAWEDHFAVTKLLLEAGAEKEVKDMDEWTPLARAAGHGHLAVVELLVKAGADIEARDNIGLTPLARAAGYSHVDVAELLIAAGADREAKDKTGLTPLSRAAKSGHLAVAQLLVHAGADKDVKDDDGFTPLDWATNQGYSDVMEFLGGPDITV